MKKFIIILIILVSASYGQNTGVPGKDFFPYMSFWDFAVYPKHVRQGHNCSSQAYVDSMLLKSFYYPLLVDLGLTNIVSDFGFINSYPSLNSTYGNIKFLDMDFGWDGNGDGPFDPGRYVKATGNNPDKFGHQIGGTWNMSWSPDEKNYGFGTTDMSSRWAMEPSKQPAVSPTLTGDNTTDVVPPIISEESQVRYASIEDNHTPGGTIFFGNIDAGHFPHTDTTYQLSFFIRGDATELERMDARVVVLQIYVIPGDALYTKPYNSNMTIKEPNLTEGIETNFLSAAYEVTAGELQDSAGTYRWITTPAFKVPGDTNIAYYAVWTGEATIYCDRMIMFNEFYDRMFNPTLKSNPIAPPDFGTQITSKYNGSNPALHSMYVDEPPLLATEAFSHINDLVWSTLNGGSTAMELNGAIGPHAEWGMRFDQQYGKSAVDNTYKRKYLLYNVYPFRQEFDTTQSDVQAALEELINFRFIGDDATKHPYQYLGLRPAIRAAKKFDDQLTEDIPLIFILQVHAEHIVYNSGKLFSIVPNATSMRRAPTRDEIFVQGNMALAYGAKGFMFYMVPTWNSEPEPNKTVWNTFGIFDEFQNPYQGVDGPGLVQNPCNAQVPNYRYHATKALIENTRKIENIILGLNWNDTKSWHNNSACSVDWISNIVTRYPHFPGNDGTSERYVETGYFNEIDPPSGKVEDAKFVYLVNRRCNIQSPYSPSNPYAINDTSYRNITLTLNFPNSIWDYYTVKDLKTDSLYFTTKTGDVTIFLGAGEGTLLKIEPQITNITQNDTLGHNTTFYSDLTVSNNATLTILEGTTLTFENNSRLLLSNGNLKANGTAQEPVVFDFVTPYWQSTTNGIVNNYGNVVLHHAKIKNAAIGYYSYSTDNDDIQNCEIFNNQWGIVMHWTHSYGTEKAKILNCNIHDNSTWDNQGRGITLSNSSPQIYATTIRKNDYGLYCTTNSNPHDTIDEANGYNIIDSNDVGVISYYSTPMLGFVEDEQGDIFYLGGGNTIKDNSLFNVKSYDNSNVYVERDYWGTKDTSLFNIYSDSTSSIYTDYCLDDPPSGSIQSVLASKTTMKIDAEWMPPSQGNFTSGGQSNLLRAARKQIRLGNMTAARAILLPLLNNLENMQMSCGALELYGKTYNPEDIESFFSVLLSVGNRPVKNDLTAKALFLLSEYQTDRKETHLTNLISVYQGTDHAARASYLKIVHLIGEGNRIAEIDALKNDMNRLYPLSSYTKEVNYLIVSGTNMMKPSTSASSTETVPLEYNLLNNYPNPFNPETMIQFSLKERSTVTLDVYNIAGQKVSELVKGEMEKGIYEKRFNGTKLSSGVYIFRLNAQSLEHANINYTKTMKVLLLK